MKKLAVILFILIISGCDIKEPSSSSDTQVLTHDVEQNGIALQATIEMEKEININASITNTSKEAIVYNDRCGIPFSISIKKDDAHIYLNSNGEEMNCESVLDPKDLKKMEPNETFEKQVTFKREINLTDQSTVQALGGMYEVSFSFQKHDNDSFISLFPIELDTDKDPEILTVEQARDRAKEKDEVKKWFEEHEGEGMIIESEESILNDGIWTVIFRAIHKDGADRIIINIDAKSGEFREVHYDKVGLETLKLLNE